MWLKNIKRRRSLFPPNMLNNITSSSTKYLQSLWLNVLRIEISFGSDIANDVAFLASLCESHFSHIPRSVSSKPQYLNSKIRLFTPQNPNSMIMDCSLLLHGFFLVVARRRQTVKRPLGEVFLKSQYLNKPSGEVFLKSQCTNKPSGEVFLKSQCINKQFLLNPHDKDMYIRSFLRDGCNNFLFIDNYYLSNHWD